jgi:hypothetical protein
MWLWAVLGYLGVVAVVLCTLEARRRSVRRRRALEARTFELLVQHHPDGPDQDAIDRIRARIDAELRQPPHSTYGRHERP